MTRAFAVLIAVLPTSGVACSLLSKPYGASDDENHVVASDDTQIATDASADAMLELVTSGNTDPVYLRRSFSGRYASFHVGFDVRVAKAAPDDNTYLVELIVGANALLVFSGFNATHAKLQERVFNDANPVFVDHPRAGGGGSMTTASWTRIEIDLDLKSSPRTATMRIGGIVVVSGETLASSWAAGTATISVGPTFVGQPRPRRLAYDNVVLDAR